MAVLTKIEILELIQRKKLIFTPNLDDFQIQPHSIDLRLGNTFYIPKTWKITSEGRKAINADPMDSETNENNFQLITLKDGQFFELLPKEFVITTTMEKLEINTGQVMGVLYPRSSINRRGLALDLTGIIDVWYHGPLMIPIVNNTETQTIRIYPGERICQITFETLSQIIDKKTGMKHGLEKAKYSGCDAKSIGSKLDKKIEINLIREGKIKELKKKFRSCK